MYDIVYLDHTSRPRKLARCLRRESAVALARAESRRRGVGRMFLAGSEADPQGELILIVESDRPAA